MNGVHRVGELTSAADLDPARWVIEHVHGFAENVGSLVPSSFPRYARVLHPAYREDPATPDADSTRVTWAEVAQTNDRRMHPEVQFASLVGRVSPQGHEQPGLWDTEPDEGTLGAELAATLATVLGHHTTMPEQCWFAVWDGWGDLAFDSTSAATFHLPGRDYVLFTGPVSAAAQSLGIAYGEHRSANLWWPSDRAWCVATEIDLNSTYVGRSDACLAELLTTPDPEVIPTRVTDGTTAKSDQVNPPPLA